MITSLLDEQQPSIGDEKSELPHLNTLSVSPDQKRELDGHETLDGWKSIALDD